MRPRLGRALPTRGGNTRRSGRRGRNEEERRRREASEVRSYSGESVRHSALGQSRENAEFKEEYVAKMIDIAKKHGTLNSKVFILVHTNIFVKTEEIKPITVPANGRWSVR